MEDGGVVKILRPELSGRGQMYRIRCGSVETCVALVINDDGIVGMDDFFCLLKRVKLAFKDLTITSLNPLDLARIEYACVAEKRPLQMVGALHFFVSVRIFLCPCRCAREIADGFSVFTTADVPAFAVALQKSHPARIVIPIHERRNAEIYGVKPTIDGLGNRIVRPIRDASCLPWAYPRSRALLETLDDALRHLFGI
jgi:hypothetical protein